MSIFKFKDFVFVSGLSAARAIYCLEDFNTFLFSIFPHLFFHISLDFLALQGIDEGKKITKLKGNLVLFNFNAKAIEDITLLNCFI